MKVDRCVCLSITFDRLKTIAAEKRFGFEDLKSQTGCCSKCKMCEPYIRRMLDTGETVFLLDRTCPAPFAGETRVMGITLEPSRMGRAPGGRRRLDGPGPAGG